MTQPTRRHLPLAFLLALLAILSLALGCGAGEEGITGDTTAPAATTPVAATQPPTSSNCPAPTGTVPEIIVKTYDQKPPLTIDVAKKYTATVQTTHGAIVIALRPDLAPEHVNSFVFLAREGFYNGVTFHRVLPGFVAQAGDPTGTGSGGPGYTLPAEFTTAEKFARGSLGMARSGEPNSAGSQWFINYAATPSLDGAYTIFGNVTEGMEVVDCITPRDPSRGGNLPPGDAIISIDITEE